jgi:predicted alpha/beta hydrolase
MNQLKINTKLGHKIAITYFTPKKPKGIIVIASATGVKQKYYQNFAMYLQANNYIVYTFDYNGIGLSNSQNIKEIKTNASNWGNNDLEAVLNYALTKSLDLKLNIIGHSIGGQLIGFASAAKKADTIILVASQSGHYNLWQGFERFKLYLFFVFIIPVFTKFFGYLPSKIFGMENLPKEMSLEWANWCRKTDYFSEVIPKDKLQHHKIKANLISYSTENDNYASVKAVNWLAKKYKNCKVKRIDLKPEELNMDKIGHFDFFKKRFESPIWEMFLENITE